LHEECFGRVNKLKVAKDKNKLFLGIIGDILRDWGLCIVVHKKNVRVDKKIISIFTYTLSYDNNIDKHI
jgi:hypothetical protein